MPVIERDGSTVHYSVSGSGPAVLMGHSFLLDSDMWAPQVDDLSRDHQVITVDVRGHGRSRKVAQPFSLYDLVDDGVAILDRENIGDAVWCGLSIGGMVALRAALVAPDRVRALVIADSDAGAERAWQRVKYGVLGAVVRVLGPRPVMRPVVGMMFGKTTRRENADLVRTWSERMAGIHVPSILHGLSALTRRDSVLPRLGEIDRPTLVLVGEEDTSLPPDRSRQIQERIPGAELEVIPGAGHISSLEQPDAVTLAIRRFIERLP